MYRSVKKCYYQNQKKFNPINIFNLKSIFSYIKTNLKVIVIFVHLLVYYSSNWNINKCTCILGVNGPLSLNKTKYFAQFNGYLNLETTLLGLLI